MEFLDLVKQVAPNAKENQAIIILNTDLSAEELAFAFSDLGCHPQKEDWTPVSEELAITDFGDASVAGCYFMETVLDDGLYAFDISADGKNIDYVWMGD